MGFPANPQDAVDYALQQGIDHASNPVDSCEQATAVAYVPGHAWANPPGGEPTAIAHWYDIKRNMPDAAHGPDSAPPAGALVFWEGGSAGHTAISVGQGWVESTDYPKAGKRSLVPISDITDNWGKTYVGWTDPAWPKIGVHIPNERLTGVSGVGGIKNSASDVAGQGKAIPSSAAKSGHPAGWIGSVPIVGSAFDSAASTGDAVKTLAGLIFSWRGLYWFIGYPLVVGGAILVFRKGVAQTTTAIIAPESIPMIAQARAATAASKARNKPAPTPAPKPTPAPIPQGSTYSIGAK